MRPLVGLIAARLRRRGLAALLVPAAVAPAALALLATGPASLLAEDSALERALRDAPASARTVRVDVTKTANTQLARDGDAPGLDAETEREARAALPREQVRGPVGQGVLFSGFSRGDGGEVRLLAVDHPERRLALSAGRRPAPCTRRVCEAVVLGESRPRALRDLRFDDLRIRLVGRGRLDSAVLGPVPPPHEPAQAGRVAPAFLMLGGLREVEHVPALEFLPRRYSWSRQLDPAAVHPWTVDTLTDRIGQGRARLGASGLAADVTAPDGLLLAERQRGRVAARRLLVIAGLAAAALLAFAILAAALRRRDVGAELDRLREAGARRGQLLAFLAMEAGVLAGTGVVVGAALAVAGTALAGTAVAGDGGVLLRETLAGPESLAVAAGVGLAATLVLMGALAPTSARRGWGLDLAAAGALALVIWQAQERGSLGAQELAAGAGAPPEVVLLPGLLALVAGLAAARLAPLALRGIERAVRGGGLTLRLALLGLTRHPGRTGAAAGFLAAGLTLGLFALSYADRLAENAAAHAAFTAGADLRVTEGPPEPGGAPDVLPFARYERVGARTAAPAIRLRAETLVEAGGSGPVALLGLPARQLDRLPAVRRALGEGTRRLARDLMPGRGLALAGARIPPGARWLRIRAAITGSAALLELPVQRPDGRFQRLTLVPTGGGLRELRGGNQALEARLPRGVAGGRVLGVEVTIPLGFAITESVGTVRLGALDALGPGAVRTRVTDFRGGAWTPSRGSRLEPAPGGAAQLRYETSGAQGIAAVRARQPGGTAPLPAVVSPALADEAGPDGILPVQLGSGEPVRLAVTRVVDGLPTTGRRFALVDVARLHADLNAEGPGAAVPNEAWLTLKDPGDESKVRAALAAPGSAGHFREPQIASRAVRTHAIRADAFSRSALGALRIAAALALAIAVLGLVLAVRTALRDEAAELVELEALGVAPAALRRQLRLGGALLGAAGLVFGVAGAIALTETFGSLVRLSADARDPLPALLPGVAWVAAGAALAVVIVTGASALALITWRGLAGPAAGRLGG
jgi:hypothetical protein